MRGKVVLVAFAIVLFSRLYAGATESPSNGPWAKFGVIQVEITKGGNGERILETEIDGKKFLHLFVLPSGLDIYSDANKVLKEPIEISLGSRLLVYFVTKCLTLAYPDGPNSVPSATTSKKIEFGSKNIDVTVTTQRLTEHDFRYDLGYCKTEEAKIAGVWGDRLLNPLPNNFSLIGWHYESPDALKTLQEARSAKLQRIPGAQKK